LIMVLCLLTSARNQLDPGTEQYRSTFLHRNTVPRLSSYGSLLLAGAKATHLIIGKEVLLSSQSKLAKGNYGREGRAMENNSLP